MGAAAATQGHVSPTPQSHVDPAALVEPARAAGQTPPQRIADSSSDADANTDAEASPYAATHMVAAARYGMHLTIDTETRAMLEEAGALLGHQLASGDLAGLVKLALRSLIEEQRKKRFAVGRRPRVRSSGPTELRVAPNADSLPPGDSSKKRSVSDTLWNVAKKPRSRHIPAADARAVYERDAGQCTFVSEDGRRCAARRSLEIDHVQPFAEGGASTSDNLRLRCRAHNQYRACLHFGTARMSAAIDRVRGRTRTRQPTAAAEPWIGPAVWPPARADARA